MQFLAKLKSLSNKIKEDDVMPWASMLTLYLLLSLFPMIILITELLSLTPLFSAETLSWLGEYLPSSVSGTLEVITSDITDKHNSAIIPATVIMTIWSMSRGMMAIIKSLNKSYGIAETRHYFHLRFLAFIYTLGMLFVILLTLLLIVFGNRLLLVAQQWVVIPDAMNRLILILRYGLTVLYAMLFFIALYNLAPSTSVTVRKVIPGAAFTSIALLLLSTLFSYYVKYFGNLSYLYGSLTGFVILILWLYMVSTTIMIGGEINMVFSGGDLKSVETENGPK